jgi:hypothetical protein
MHHEWIEIYIQNNHRKIIRDQLLTKIPIEVKDYSNVLQEMSRLATRLYRGFHM